MIYGVGIDLVSISRMEAAIERHGQRFAERVLGDRELQGYADSSRKAAFLAKHFAAKEALLKALGTGLRSGIQWRDMQVHNDSLGKPFLVCDGRVRALFDEHGVTESHLSITDEQDYAAAFVTLVCAPS